jgi:hypothetical protein
MHTVLEKDQRPPQVLQSTEKQYSQLTVTAITLRCAHTHVVLTIYNDNMQWEID